MNALQLSLAALAAAGMLGLSTVAPASADSAASTRNIFLGAAAIAGFAIESNVAHKNAQAHRISGYLPDGSAVYADGHVVTTNGYSYYPGNNGQSVSCNDTNCFIANTNANNNQNGNGYAGRYYGDNGGSLNGSVRGGPRYESDRDGGGSDRNAAPRYGNDRNNGQR